MIVAFTVGFSGSSHGVVAAGLVNCGNAELKDGETTLSDACRVGKLCNTGVELING